MSIYIALLRGINVSGQKKVNMKELTTLLGSLGLKQVTTYIQSGNIVFSCVEHSEGELSKLIEKAIANHFGFDVPVFVLSQQSLNQALENLPFKDISVAEQGSQVIFSFLSDEIKAEETEKLQQYLISDEKIYASSNLIYLHCPNGYGKTKLSNTFIERKLNLTSTSRNLKTVVKLCELAQECQ